MADDFGITGKVALVTGASSGIGLACSEALATAGASVIMTARDAGKLGDAAERISAKTCSATLAAKLDVRRRGEVELFVRNLQPPWSGVDFLINSAGGALGLEKIQDGDPDEWDEMLDSNVKGLLYITKSVLAIMLRRGGGHIVNIGSVAGREVYQGGNVYCASKYAVRALSKAMRMDLLGTPIRITTVDPGMVETNFSVVRFRGDRERAAKVYEGLEALTGADVAEAVVWALGRPPRVNVSELVLMPTAQASATLSHRGPWKSPGEG